MTDPTILMDPIVNEAKRTLNEMKKTKDLNERKIQSEIVNSLCQSMGVFFDVMSNAVHMSDVPDFLDDE